MFGEKTVDKVVAALRTTLEDLRQVKASQDARATGIQEQIVSLEEERVAAVAEGQRAERIALRLDDLLA